MFICRSSVTLVTASEVTTLWRYTDLFIIIGDNVIAITPFEFRNDFDVVGLRKFCSCYRVFNVVFASLDGAIREC